MEGDRALTTLTTRFSRTTLFNLEDLPFGQL